MSRIIHSLLIAVTCLGCGTAPTILNMSGFDPVRVARSRVLMLPLATTSEMGDDRTGIVLSDASVRDSYQAACEASKRIHPELDVRCIRDVHPAIATVRDVQFLFARDKAMEAVKCQALASQFGAAYALLLRPESVSAANTGPAVSLSLADTLPIKGIPVGQPEVTQQTAGLMAGLVGVALVRSLGLDKVRRSRAYGVSAALLELRSCRTFRVGTHIVQATSTDGSFPAAPRILTQAITELSEAIMVGEENAKPASSEVTNSQFVTP